MERPLVIDCDNALGSPHGDVDDAYALAYAVAWGLKPSLITSVGGNTSAARGAQNTAALLEVLGARAPHCEGNDPRRRRESPGVAALDALLEAHTLTPSLSRGGVDVLALGPLTNIATVLARKPTLAAQLRSLTCVAGTLRTRGRFPPLWPFEYNITKDVDAFQSVLASGVPFTVCPLDVCARFRVRLGEVPSGSPALEFLRAGTRRWQRWSYVRYLSSRFPLWDVVAVALCTPDARFLRVRETRLSCRSNGFLAFDDPGGVPARVVVDADVEGLRASLFRVLQTLPAP